MNIFTHEYIYEDCEYRIRTEYTFGRSVLSLQAAHKICLSTSVIKLLRQC